MNFKKIFLGIIVIFVIALVIIYWLIPYGVINFNTFKAGPRNYEFNAGNSTTSMQFYPNMRFIQTNLSYRIEENCSVQKKNDMKKAFEFMQNRTVLSFYPVSSGEEITVTCDNSEVPSGNGLFVAGEGGPTKIIQDESFYIIESGKILLLKNSECQNPNVDVHELLHVLGFAHSKNQNNLMYPVSDCSQEIGNQIPDEINRLYSIPALPDLAVENATAKIHDDNYVDINATVRNIGFATSASEKLSVYGDGNLIKEIDLKGLSVGEYINVRLTNVFFEKIKIKELNVSVETGYPELNSDNNWEILSENSGS